MISELATPTYLQIFVWHEAKPRTSKTCCCSHARNAITLSDRFRLMSLARSPFEDPKAPVVLMRILRKWNPRPACGTACTSVRISISVSHSVSKSFPCFIPAGGRSAIASLLPTKTLAIGSETRPDQSGAPAFNTLTPMVHPAAVCWFHGSSSCYSPLNPGFCSRAAPLVSPPLSFAATRKPFCSSAYKRSDFSP